MLRGQSNQAASATVARWASVALCALLLTTGTALGQGSTTATIRGNVQDPSGGVLPGATVTVTNTGTKAIQTVTSDERGQYQFAALFPGTYDLRVELSGFKSYERKGLTLSPNDNRGIDVRLDVGQQSETITVTAQQEVIQTQTGAREGVLSAKQIDNLSVIGRSALELLRILPGVVDRVQPGRVGELRRRREQHPGLHRQRHPVVREHRVARRLVAHRHRQQQRPDRDPEQRHGSGGQGPELELRGGIRHRRHERQRVSPRPERRRSTARCTTTRATAVRRERPFQQHRRHGEAEEQVSIPRRQHRRPDHLRRQLHQEPRQAVLLRRVRSAASAGRLGFALQPHLLAGDAQRRLQRAARQPRVEPEQRRAAAHPAGLPECRAAGAEQRHAAVHHADGEVSREPVSAPEL